MNDPLLLATKLSELVDLARAAETPFERAAVFAATESIASRFRSPDESFSGYQLEKVGQARSHIAAAVGYDIDNGHDRDAHIGWAIGAINNLKNQLERRRAAAQSDDD